MATRAAAYRFVLYSVSTAKTKKQSLSRNCVIICAPPLGLEPIPTLVGTD